MRVRILVCLCGLALFPSLRAQQLQTLEQELRRIGASTAIVMPTPEVQEYPLWSPQGDALAVSVMGAWQKIDLSRLSLKPSTWQGNLKVGVLNSKSISAISRDEISAWKKVSKSNQRRVTTRSGLRIELKLDEFGATTSLIVAPKGDKPRVLWVAAMESYQNLVLSPDEMYVAFVSAVHGVVVMRLTDLE